MLRIDAGLHEVLYECLAYPNDLLESLDVLDALHELVHLALALCQGGRTLLVPEFLVAHLGVGLQFGVSLELECAVWNGGEIPLAVFHSTLHLHLLDKRGQFHLDNHLVVGHHLLACGKRLEVLDYIHLLHKVHIRSAGDAYLCPLHAPSGVGQHVQGT